MTIVPRFGSPMPAQHGNFHNFYKTISNDIRYFELITKEGTPAEITPLKAAR